MLVDSVLGTPLLAQPAVWLHCGCALGFSRVAGSTILTALGPGRDMANAWGDVQSPVQQDMVSIWGLLVCHFGGGSLGD